MTAFYPVSAPVVHPGDNLPSRVLSFYRWLCRWYSQTGDVHPCTGYFARKQKVSERTIYRWLAALKALGFIETDVLPGVQRSIVPLKEPPRKRPRRSPLPTASPSSAYAMSGVCQGSVSGVPPLNRGDALEASTPDVVTPAASGDAPAARSEEVSAGADEVKCLVAAGLPAKTAAALVQVHGLKAARNALMAYRAAKGIKNPAGWLIRAIERRYQFAPSAPSTVNSEAYTAIYKRPASSGVDGLQGKAAFDALRGKLRLAGRV